MTEKTFNSLETNTTITVHNGKDGLLKHIFNMLTNRGFAIQHDQEIAEAYPSLRETHWEGSKGDLRFKANRYPAGFRFDFYQEIHTKNPNGGFYDFDKFQKMPYLVRCEYLVNQKHLHRLLEDNGFINVAQPVFKKAEDAVMHRIKTNGHYEEGKELPTYEVKYGNGKDRDAKQIRNGELKYFRDAKGRLMRGRVFYNLNNMWWVLLNKRTYTNLASWELFDLRTEKDRTPKLYSRQMPQRVRAEKLRQRFGESVTYLSLKEDHLAELRRLVSDELAAAETETKMSLSVPLKKDAIVLKTKGLRYASLKVDGSYFNAREGITFGKDGYIGFAGWASGSNLAPFLDAFEKWMIGLAKEEGCAA